MQVEGSVKVLLDSFSGNFFVCLETDGVIAIDLTFPYSGKRDSDFGRMTTFAVVRYIGMTALFIQSLKLDASFIASVSSSLLCLSILSLKLLQPVALLPSLINESLTLSGVIWVSLKLAFED